MKVVLHRPITLDNKKIKEIDLKLETITGKDILRVDMELREEGQSHGFDSLYNQQVLLRLASKASGILAEDLEKLKAHDFLEVIFSVRNFFFIPLVPTEEPATSEEVSTH